MAGQSSGEAWFVASFAANPKQLAVPHFPQLVLGRNLYISTAVFMMTKLPFFMEGVKFN
jgi:hypothetical protein